MKLKGISDQGIRRIAQTLPQQENARQPRIQIAWVEKPGDYDNIETFWVDLAGKSLEDVQSIMDDHPNSTVYDTEGFGDWENMEDEPLETIMAAAETIMDLGSPDEYFRVGL